MTLSLICSCGARLEIDDKFAGQLINCPDCQRPLSTTPPNPEPAQTSGYALASLILALIGAFTVVGTIAAVVCGVLALTQIRRAPEQIGGRHYARAGIVLGIGGTLLTLVLMATTQLLKVDGLLRALEWAGKIEYAPDDLIAIRESDIDPERSGSMRRPSPSWGRLTFKKPDTPREKTDDLVLANLWEDAYIVCLTKFLDPGQDLETCREEGQLRFLQSELVNRILGRTADNSPAPTGQDRERKQIPGTETQEFLLDVQLAGINRTFLVRVIRDGNRLNIIAGGTRANRFTRALPDILKALDSYKTEK